jgi:uncharacterized protein (DUF433 family)
MADTRFAVPLYTPTEVAQHLHIPTSTVGRWSSATAAGLPLMHRLAPESPRSASIPFIALTEAHILRSFRDAGVSMPKIKETVGALRREFDDPYALARKDLGTDGVEVVRRVQDDSGPGYYVPRTGQQAFSEVLEDCLRYVTWDDRYPVRLGLPAYAGADVVVDTRFGFGQPVFRESKVRVEDVVDLFFAGETIRTVAEQYGVSEDEVEVAVRAAGWPARAA